MCLYPARTGVGQVGCRVGRGGMDGSDLANGTKTYAREDPLARQMPSEAASE